MAARWMVEYHDEGRLESLLPGVLSDRIAGLRRLAAASLVDTESIWAGLNLEARVQDVRTTDIPVKTIDLFISYEVLEYIPREALAEIFGLFCRQWASPRGTMSHYIDLRNEYSFFDRKLSPLNFLRFSTRTWQMLSNPLPGAQSAAGLDYARLLSAAGCEIISEVHTRADSSLLEKFPLAAPFRDYAPEDCSC